MPSNANDLMTAVASFMGRERSTFIRNGFDVLLQACNNARLFAERQIDFELSRTSVRLNNVSLTNGGSLDDCVLFSDNDTQVNVKKIKKAFLSFTNSTNQFPISFHSRDHWLRRVQRNAERIGPTEFPVLTDRTYKEMLGALQPFAVVQMGRQVYVAPAVQQAIGDSFTLYFDVLAWLPPYGQEAVIGIASSTSALKLVNTVGDFVNQEVRVGMVVTNTTDGTSATITAVESPTTLVLTGDIFTSGEGYSILTADEEDFLIENCFDWLLYRCVWELNFFVKEDERVQLSRDLINEAWNAIIEWNSNLISQSTDDTSLE